MAENHIGCIGDGCPICPKLADPRYDRVRAHLTRTAPSTSRVENLLACIHRGSRPLRLAPCIDCVNRKVSVIPCAIHGECTLAENVRGKDGRYMPACRLCEDRCNAVLGGNAMLLTGGIGDVLAIEGLLTDGERARLETIYYACPSSSDIIQLFPSLKNYPRLTNHVVLPTGGLTFYTKTGVEKAVGSVAADDCSIATVFPRGLEYRGSSFLPRRVADLGCINSRYAVIVSGSTWGKEPGRAFNMTDWHHCVAHLKAMGLRGIVLSRERQAMPQSDWLEQRQLPILQAIEAVKGASAYIGIDSWASVLAAKLFSGNCLVVKSVSQHLYKWKATYYAPQTDFSFIRERIEPPA